MIKRKQVVQDQAGLVARIKEAGLNRVVGRGLRKTAGIKHDSQAVIYAEGLTKKHKDNEVIVTVACSSYEIYGANSNGDGFPSEKAIPGLGFEEKDLLTKHYKSFENGKLYYNHDMSYAIGYVHKAFWNDVYKWVEIVVEVDHTKAEPYIIEKIRKGDMVFVSMGCLVKYDICTVCGKKSVGDDYCQHIKKQLLEVVDDTVVAMLNPSPNFDDISIVFIPADAIAFSLHRRKAASKGKTMEFIKGLQRKSSVLKETLTKIASIYKDTAILKGLDKFKDNYKPLVDEMDKGMSEGELSDTLMYFYSRNIPLPVQAVADKYGIDMEVIIEMQAEIAGIITEDDHIMELFRKSGDPDNIMELVEALPDKLFKGAGDKKKGEAAIVAIFNLCNKINLMEEGVDPGILPEDSPIVKEIERIVELEYLCKGGDK